VFLAFFLLFTLASLAVPVPLFPGNMVPIWFTLPSDYTSFFSAVTNGITYGLIVWLIFVLATRNLDESAAADVKGRKGQSQRDNKKRTVKH